jgi:hypothetical protein
MKNKKFTHDEICRFVNALSFPVAYFVNRSGNIEFCPIDIKTKKPLGYGKVWFKFVRTVFDDSMDAQYSNELEHPGYYVADRFWKCVQHSSSWQLFRDSNSSEHFEFDTPESAAARMNEYVKKNGIRQILKSCAICRWWQSYSHMKGNFVDRCEKANMFNYNVYAIYGENVYNMINKIR